jgi:sarcosine oxidase
VLVLEQYAVGHDRGSSHGSSRIYRRAYEHPSYIALTGRAGEEWDRLEDESGVPLRTQTGGLDAGDGRARQMFDRLRAEGVDATLLSAAEVAERWPGIALTARPASTRRRPPRRRPHRHHPARPRGPWGCGAREDTAADQVEPVTDGLLVHHGSGEARVGSVVVAAVAWLPELIGGLAVTPDLPSVQVRQVEVFHHRHRDPEARWPTLVHDSEVQLYALSSGSDAGPGAACKIGQYDSDCTTTASTRDGVIDDRPRRAIRSFVEQQLPGLDPDPVGEKSCLFTMTSDEDFVLDRATATGGSVVIASPCSGHGAKFAPLVGVLVADLVEGAAPDPRFAFRGSPPVRGHA